MGFLTGALITLAVGAGATLLFKGVAEEKKRKNTPCSFNDKITEEEFKYIAEAACSSIKRVIEVSVEGPIVNASVRSQSGISNWQFKIDFNDYGSVTGKYWLTNENSDSQIPSVIAERIKEEINKRINQ